MPFPIPKPRDQVKTSFGSEYARSVTDSLQSSLNTALRPLSAADKNRVLLALAAWIASQLETLETNTETSFTAP